MSPILDAFGGAIEKIYFCENCKRHKVALENFVSLNFQKLLADELAPIRAHFRDKNYKEGMVFEESKEERKSFINKLISPRRKQTPITTLRDYFCHLNFTQGNNK